MILLLKGERSFNDDEEEKWGGTPISMIRQFIIPPKSRGRG
jgi:hypothetical protein